MARDAGPTGSAWRLLWLAVLPGLLLVSDVPRLARAGAVGERAASAEGARPAASASGPAPADAYVQGIPWVGEPGVTETVAEIMAREHATAQAQGLDVAQVREPKPRRVLESRHGDDPAAPAVPHWPPAPDAAGAEAAPEQYNPQTIGTSFLGAQVSESGFIPPDSVGAVGLTQVLVAVNGRIKVFDKQGNLGGLNTSTNNFFASVRTPSTGTSDPHVRYDRLSGRWFVTMIDVASVNRILIAVSSGSTITDMSSFTFFQFQHDLVGTTPNADTGFFADYDTLGVDKFALYIGVNVFNGNLFTGTTGFVINKANLLASTLTVTAFRQLAGNTCPSTGVYTPQGVHNDDPQATEGYFIGVDICLFSKLVIRRITDPGGTPAISGNLALTVPTTTFPIPQVQPSPGPTLDALDDRLFAASVHTNKITGAKTLWTAHNIEVNASGVGDVNGNRNGSRWYEIGSLTTTPTLIQSGTLFDSAGATPFGFWIPSVAMSGQGHMAIASSRASANASGGHASIAAAGRLRTDALGTTQAPTLAQGSSFSYSLGGGTVKRWGDYSQVVVDPTDDQTMWTFQEYANATNSWGVRAIQLKAPLPATPAMATPSNVASGQASVNVTITGTSVAGSEFFDPGPDTGGPGFPNHIMASVTGGVVVNSVTFDNPTQVTLNISTVGATAGAKDVTITNPDGQSQTGTGLLTVTVSPATVSVSGGTLSYMAGAGAPNNLTVTLSGGVYTLTDTGTTITAGAGCSPVTPNQATCADTGITLVSIDLGDLNDVATLNLPLAPMVTVAGGTGTDTLVVVGTAGPDTFTITGTTIAGAGTTISYAGVEQLTLNGQGGDDTFTVNAPLAAPVTVDGAAGTDALTVNGTAGADVFTVTGTTVTGAGTTITYANVEQLTINGGAGNDTVTLNAPLSVPLLLDGGGDTDMLVINGTASGESFIVTGTTVSGVGATVTYANLEQLTVNAGAGNDTVTVNAPLTVPVTLDGGPGTDALVVNGTAGIENFTLTGTTVTVGGVTITYANFEQLTLNGQGGDDTFTVNAPLSAPVTVDGGAGTDLLTVNGTAGADTITVTGTTVTMNGVTITYANFEQLTVNAGAGDDTVTVNGTSVPTTLDGGPGNDVLDVNDPGTGALITVNFEIQCFPPVGAVPDGRVSPPTLIAAGGAVRFVFSGTAGHSYSAEVHHPDNVTSDFTVVFGAAGDSCPTSNLAGLTLTSGVDSPLPTSGVRGSFTASATGNYVTRITNTTGSGADVTFSVSETTLYSPAWSTNGTFDTFFSFQNTTNTALNGTLTLFDTAGTVVTTVNTGSIAPGGTFSTNTATLGTTRNLTGTATFSHNGPPGAVLAEAAIANFTLSPTPYIQIVKFQPVRQSAR